MNLIQSTCRNGKSTKLYFIGLSLILTTVSSLAQSVPAGLDDLKIYRLTNGHHCLVDGKELNCYDRIDQISCRSSWSYFSIRQLQEKVIVLPVIPFEYERVKLDGEKFCVQNAKGIFKTGEYIQALASIKFLPLDGSQGIQVPVGGEMIVMQKMLRSSNFSRDYQVVYNGIWGVIDGGNQKSYSSRLKSSGFIDKFGQKGETVLAQKELIMRNELGGSFVAKIAKGSRIKISKVRFQKGNRLWYDVEFGTLSGVIYGGSFGSYSKWVRASQKPVIKARFPGGKKWGRLITSLKHVHPWIETRISSNQSTVAVTNNLRFEIKRLSRYGWYLVESIDGKSSGWVPKQFVEIIRD